MEDMIEEAVKKQFENYALTKKKKNITGQVYRPKRSTATESEVDELWRSYLADYYPGSKLEPQKLVQLFRPKIDPDDYIAAKSIIDPESVCIETKAESCEYPWRQSSLPGIDCVGNFGYGLGTQQRCEEHGGQMIDFDQVNNPKAIFEDLCYLDGGIDVEGDVEISKDNVVGVIKNWGKTFHIEFEIELKRETTMWSNGNGMNIAGLNILKLRDGSNKNMVDLTALIGKKYQIVCYDSNERPSAFVIWIMEPELNTKYKFVLRQVKKGTKYGCLTKTR